MCSATCPKCSSDMIEVIESRFFKVVHVRTAPCMCEESDTDLAWETASVDTLEEVEISWLTENGGLEFVDHFVDVVDQDPQDTDIYCHECRESYLDALVDVKEESRKVLPTMAKRIIRCSHCLTEIDIKPTIAGTGANSNGSEFAIISHRGRSSQAGGNDL